MILNFVEELDWWKVLHILQYPNHVGYPTSCFCFHLDLYLVHPVDAESCTDLRSLLFLESKSILIFHYARLKIN